MQEVVALVSGLGSLVGVFTYFQWQVQKRALKLDLMTKVHERYSKLYERLACIETHTGSFGDLRDADKEAVSAYFNLCAEQFHWRTAERLIDDAVWEVWAAAMGEKFRQPAFRDAWVQHHKRDLHYRGFAEFVEQQIATDPTRRS